MIRASRSRSARKREPGVCSRRAKWGIRIGGERLLLVDLQANVLVELDVVLLEVVGDGSLENLGVEELLVEEDALAVEAVHLAFGNLLGDLLRFAGGLGL